MGFRVWNSFRMANLRMSDSIVESWLGAVIRHTPPEAWGALALTNAEAWLAFAQSAPIQQVQPDMADSPLVPATDHTLKQQPCLWLLQLLLDHSKHPVKCSTEQCIGPDRKSVTHASAAGSLLAATCRLLLLSKLATLVSSIKYTTPEVVDADVIIWSVINGLSQLQHTAEESGICGTAEEARLEAEVWALLAELLMSQMRQCIASKQPQQRLHGENCLHLLAYHMDPSPLRKLHITHEMCAAWIKQGIRRQSPCCFPTTRDT